jgi:hypothetical protein
MTRQSYTLTNSDLDFLISAAAPDVVDKAGLKRHILTDPDFRDAFVADDKTFERIESDRETFVRISPALYFEILLRKARSELERTGHTVEKAGGQRIPVFDTAEVAALLSNRELILYLAQMLASFTKTHSYSFTYRARKGIWRKVRFNDMDIDSLLRMVDWVEEDQRLGLFQRIADICLFILGIYRDSVDYGYRYPVSGERRPPLPGVIRRDVEDYESEGRRFYRLAAEHPAAESLELSPLFQLLCDHFYTASKPLGFIADHYMHYQTAEMFGKSGE